MRNVLLITLLIGLSISTAQAQECETTKTQKSETIEHPNNPNPQPKIQKEKRETPKTCNYKAYAWNTKTRSTTKHFSVSKPYADVSDDERDPQDPRCTICSEDQVSIDPQQWGFKAKPIQVCYVYAEQISQALKDLAESDNVDIDKLEGYRPGRTRGKIDKNGLRTQWSNHSFGTAIDINPHRNALYTQCPKTITNTASDVENCKRSIGGAYHPEKYPRLSITKNGDIYKAFTKFYKWGGEISGQTKDIMHFSITGY